MKRLFTFLYLLSLLLAFAIAGLWIYSYRHEGNLYWGRQAKALFDEREDGVTGASLDADWDVSWKHGELALYYDYAAESFSNPYTSAPGFPPDPEIVKQYEQGWTKEVKEFEDKTPAHGFESKAERISDSADEPTWQRRRGFDWKWPQIPRTCAQIRTNSGGSRGLWFPAWAPLALTMILPTAWLARLARRRRRIAKHLCTECGYDLRATPQRCPECGKVAK